MGGVVGAQPAKISMSDVTHISTIPIDLKPCEVSSARVRYFARGRGRGVWPNMDC